MNEGQAITEAAQAATLVYNGYATAISLASMIGDTNLTIMVYASAAMDLTMIANTFAGFAQVYGNQAASLRSLSRSVRNLGENIPAIGSLADNINAAANDCSNNRGVALDYTIDFFIPADMARGSLRALLSLQQ